MRLIHVNSDIANVQTLGTFNAATAADAKDWGDGMSARCTASSSSMPGPVSAWIGDRLKTSKLPRRRTRHPGQLSLSNPSGVGTMSTQRKLKSTRHIALSALARIRGLPVWAMASLAIGADVRKAVAH